MQNINPELNDPRKAAIQDFQQARMRAALQQVTSRLSGKPANLLSYNDVAKKLKVTNWSEVDGVKQIPIAAIVGSVGRYTDFTSTFLPKQSSDQDRWVSVKTAADSVTSLPPIQVYQIGDAYFILDGNHRVSIARQQGLDYIDAVVTKIQTRVPFSAHDQPDTLIIKAEYAAFLEQTRLDKFRPEADLRVTAPGQYEHLENHIEVHRYFMETAESRELSDKEAVCSWYDDAYLPVVAALNERGILRYFPGRTETDFYIFLATHQRALQHELGWEVRPEAAVTQLAKKYEAEPRRFTERLFRRVLKLVPEKWHEKPVESWSQQKALDRYHDHLLADILVVAEGVADEPITFSQALVLAQREKARLVGLVPEPDGDENRQAAEQIFQQLCRVSDINGQLSFADHIGWAQVCERALWCDLVVIGKTDAANTPEDSKLDNIVYHNPRPTFVVRDKTSNLTNVLLVYDGSAKAQEGLFVAVYLAEQWGSQLTVLVPSALAKEATDASTYANRYLDMHEISAEFENRPEISGASVLETAASHQSDVIIMGQNQTPNQDGLDNTISHLLKSWPLPLLIC